MAHIKKQKSKLSHTLYIISYEYVSSLVLFWISKDFKNLYFIERLKN